LRKSYKLLAISYRLSAIGYRLSPVGADRRASRAARRPSTADCRPPTAARRLPRADRRLPTAERRAFTLIELLVVVAIIVLLIGIAVPVLGPALNSGQQSQMVQQLTGAITIAQARAINQGGYAIRIERAFKTDIRGLMVDANGQTADDYYKAAPYNLPAFNASLAPVWLNYQQIRYLKPSRVNPCYEPTIDDVIKLPPNVWLAPDYAMYSSAAFAIITDPWKISTSVPNTFMINPLDTFCIVFDSRGSVIQLRPYQMWSGIIVAAQSDKYQYQDQTQPVGVYPNWVPPPAVPMPYSSARGAILYDRKQFDSFGGDVTAKATYLATKGRPFFVNRYMGSLVEGRTQ
jgi:prepilin-type N-terminal cleavage/methylation domain-containing protein